MTIFARERGKRKSPNLYVIDILKNYWQFLLNFYPKIRTGNEFRAKEVEGDS